MDEKSPLYGLDEHNFEDKFLAVVVQIEGTDQTYMQKVFANKCYYPSDFRFNESFEDIMTMGTNTITVDLKGLSTTRQVTDRSKRLSFLRANTFTPDEAKKLAGFQTNEGKEDEDRELHNTREGERLRDLLMYDDSSCFRNACKDLCLCVFWTFKGRRCIGKHQTF